jgi:hypothetical protein
VGHAVVSGIPLLQSCGGKLAMSRSGSGVCCGIGVPAGVAVAAGVGVAVGVATALGEAVGVELGRGVRAGGEVGVATGVGDGLAGGSTVKGADLLPSLLPPWSAAVALTRCDCVGSWPAGTTRTTPETEQDPVLPAGTEALPRAIVPSQEKSTLEPEGHCELRVKLAEKESPEWPWLGESVSVPAAAAGVASTSTVSARVAETRAAPARRRPIRVAFIPAA